MTERRDRLVRDRDSNRAAAATKDLAATTTEVGSEKRRK